MLPIDVEIISGMPVRLLVHCPTCDSTLGLKRCFWEKILFSSSDVLYNKSKESDFPAQVQSLSVPQGKEKMGLEWDINLQRK